MTAFLDHDELMSRIVTWAETDANIRTVLLAGSAGQPEASIDAFSDRDLHIVCRDMQPLVDDQSWIDAIAPVWVKLHLEGAGHHTWLTFYEGARKIDFVVAEEAYLSEYIEGGPSPFLARGFRTLIDKDGVVAVLPKAIAPPDVGTRPEPDSFAQTVNSFWFEAAHMPGDLVREDFWVLKLRELTMKDMLLRMMEWHTRVTFGEATRTWYIGKNLKHWVQPEIWNELHACFGGFSAAMAAPAIVAQMKLFRRLTHEVAAEWNVDYDRTAETGVYTYVNQFAESHGYNA